MGDDEDPFSQQFEAVIKKIEKLVNARLTNVNDQMMTLARENDELKVRIKALEYFCRISLDNTNFISREVSLLSKELEALENFLAKKDKRLDFILSGADETVKLEQEARKKEEEAIRKLLTGALPQFKKENNDVKPN